MAATGQGNAEEKQYNFLAPATDDDYPSGNDDEIARLKKELNALQNSNPFRTAELALELQIERLRVIEISNARDVVLNRLCDAYSSIHQKNDFIKKLQQRKDGEECTSCISQDAQHDIKELDNLKAHITSQEEMIAELKYLIGQHRQPPPAPSKVSDPPPCYEETTVQKPASPVSTVELQIVEEEIKVRLTPDHPKYTYIPPDTVNPAELVHARNAVLLGIPLPLNPPDATLCAVIIPSPFTLHEFLSVAPISLRNALSNYKILHNATTLWCPDREEHGYMYVPAFKCSTNPRITTAHRWAAMDVIGRMNKSTECFYNKEGVWYYAGSYKAFKLDYLSTKEWIQLPTETISAIVKETLAGRKNSSPQNTYETSQLYAAGALKVACVGLQCVGFNQEVYKSILEHSTRFSEMKWKSLVATSSSSGTGTPGSVCASPTPSNNNTGLLSGSCIGNSSLGIGTPASTGTPGPGNTTPSPLVKTPITARNLHRAMIAGVMPVTSSGSITSIASPASTHLGTPSTGGHGHGHGSGAGVGILGLGSSLWGLAVSPTTSTGSPCITVDAAAKKVFEGGENMAVVETFGKH